jgi:hypothetical protein
LQKMKMTAPQPPACRYTRGCAWMSANLYESENQQRCEGLSGKAPTAKRTCVRGTLRMSSPHQSHRPTVSAIVGRIQQA